MPDPSGGGMSHGSGQGRGDHRTTTEDRYQQEAGRVTGGNGQNQGDKGGGPHGGGHQGGGNQGGGDAWTNTGQWEGEG
jgi:hypothetical protein